MAALSRVDSFDKGFPSFYLYIDEFQNVTTPSISTILSEARKYKLSLNIAHQDLSRFRKTLENSDNIVVITDNESKIKYVNQTFTKVTGYSLEEALGQNPNILKSGRKSKEFYEELNKTIYSGNKWNGEFENIDKYGNLSYEKASITPVFNDKGEIVEFIAIKLDITQEVLSNALVKEQQETLFAQQPKMAAMGEIIGNNAHQ
jgi:PAS domain S-box-containing protein